MQTKLDSNLLRQNLSDATINAADSILRNCVHCGFCLATCPTYQLLGSELDSPRGRIYQIKHLMEGATATAITQQHLDRCLGCRNCETTCPSGVQYTKLLESGKRLTDSSVHRSWKQQILRAMLRAIVPYRRRNALLIKIGQWLRVPLAAQSYAELPTDYNLPPVINPTKPTIILFRGCVQDGLAPSTNQALKQLLTQLGFDIKQPNKEGCCGALTHHDQGIKKATPFIQQNLEQWRPWLQDKTSRIVVAASGCGLMVKEYHELMQEDPDYLSLAEQASRATADPAELLLPYLDQLKAKEGSPKRITYHPPCTQQHGLKTDGAVEQILRAVGFELLPITDRHLCCGAAGSYAIFQPKIANQLRNNKLQQLEKREPERIVTANIGCQHHLQQGSEIPVVHWVELISIEPSSTPQSQPRF